MDVPAALLHRDPEAQRSSVPRTVRIDVFRVQGPVDADALRQAIEYAVEATLPRTSDADGLSGGLHRQVFDPSSGRSAEAWVEHELAAIRSGLGSPSVTPGPQGWLLETSPDACVLAIAWSAPSQVEPRALLFATELSLAWACVAEGRPLPEPPLAAVPSPVPQAEACAWLELPTDRARPAQRKGRVALAHRAFTLPRASSAQRLAEVAFGLLLHRYTGEAELEFPTLVHRLDPHRRTRELDRARLRLCISEGMTGAQLLAAARQEPSACASPVSFAYLEGPRSCPRSLDPVRREAAIAGPELALEVVRDGDDWDIRVAYDPDLHLPATAARLLGHYEMLLRGLTDRPDDPVATLPLLTEPERDQLDAWNATETAFSGARTLHGLVRAQVARTPERIAVAYDDRALTYAELEARANQLAHFLRAHGVGPEVRVCLFLDRSLEMVVALHGVNRSSGAWVPLAVDNAPARLAQVLESVDAPVLLTQEHLLDRLPPFAGQVVCLDRDWSRMAAYPATPPPDEATASSLAYVFYTSGSTGQPKGVMNEHGGVCNRLQWMQLAFALQPDDRVLQKTPYTFDCSIWEFYWPLMVGGRIEVAAPEEHRDPRALVRRVREHGVTTMHFVPSMLDAFVDYAPSSTCTGLRRVLCNGEVLPYELQQRFFERLPHAELHNLYGPTEAAIGVTHWPCSPTSPLPLVPIGRPISNTRIHILDPHLQALPVGIPGELYIGGVQVARGYLGRPDLTAERFIPDPFGPPGARLYKTGDRARWIEEGIVEFLGRLDNQVKLNGLRIELGDIESHLLSAPGVRQAAVLLRQDRPGQPALVGYAVAAAGAEITPEDLASHLRERLPEYMVPAHLLVLDAFPTNGSGKLDRKALPAPASREAPDEAVEAPRTPTEIALARLWCELLEVPRVGREDDFFALGGGSLLAVRVVTRLESELALSIPLGLVFEHTTLRSLAAAIDAHEDAKPRAATVLTLKHGTSETPLFCICGLHLYQALADALPPAQTVHAIYLGIEDQLLRSAARGETVDLVVEELAAEYLRCLRDVQPSGPYALLGSSFGGLLSFEVARQLRAAGEEISFLGILDEVLPGGLHGDPLGWLRAHLGHLRSGEGGRLRQGWLGALRRRASEPAPAQGRAPEKSLEERRIAALRLRTYQRAAARWDREPHPYDGPVFFVAAEQSEVTRGRRVDPLYGWQRHVQGPFTIVRVPGRHTGILFEPGVTQLAAHVARQLGRDGEVVRLVAVAGDN